MDYEKEQKKFNLRLLKALGNCQEKDFENLDRLMNHTFNLLKTKGLFKPYRDYKEWLKVNYPNG